MVATGSHGDALDTASLEALIDLALTTGGRSAQSSNAPTAFALVMSWRWRYKKAPERAGALKILRSRNLAFLAVDLMVGAPRMEVAIGLAFIGLPSAEVEFRAHRIADRPFAGFFGELEQ